MKEQKQHGGHRPGAGRKPSGKETVQLHVRLTPELKQWVKNEAERLGQSQNEFVVGLIASDMYGVVYQDNWPDGGEDGLI